MTFCKEAFSELYRLEEPITILTANGGSLQATFQGMIPLKVALLGSERTVALTEVLYVPGLAGSLISVIQLQNKGITVRTTEKNSLLIERQGTVTGVAQRISNVTARIN